MKMRIKYFEGATKLEKITKGNWLDVYASKDIFVPVNTKAMIPLGFALELPQGWEGHLAPRSSTFKTWGVIQTNSVGVVDDTYIGDNDQWHMPVYCLEAKGQETSEDDICSCFNTKYKIMKYLSHDGKYKIYKGKVFNGKYHDTVKKETPIGTWIKKGDKIGQFRIMEVMPNIEFEEVKIFGNEDREGFGSTGTK